MRQDFAGPHLAQPQVCEAKLSGVSSVARNAPRVLSFSQNRVDGEVSFNLRKIKLEFSK
jgi:hypothetical protein